MNKGLSGREKAATLAVTPLEQMRIYAVVILSVIIYAVLLLTSSSAFAEEPGKKMLSTGTIIEKRSAIISARISSYVLEVCCDVGHEVEKGSTLIKMDQAELAANVAMARARLDEAEAQSRNASLEHERAKELLARGSATQSSYDSAKAGYDRAVAVRAMAKAELEKAEIFVSYAELTAPISGVVDFKKIYAGELTAPGQPLIRIVDTKDLWFETSVKESDINKVKKGQNVIVNIDSLKGVEIEGVVSSIAPTGSRSSHSYNVRIDLPTSDRLKIGMYGKVGWPVDTEEPGARHGK